MTSNIAPSNSNPMTLSPEALARMRGAAPTDDFKPDDKLIPFLQIVQATSGFVQRNDPEFVEDARPGDILDTLNKRPRQHVAFVPVKYEKVYSEWKPNRGALVKFWGTDASKYDASGTDYATRKTAEGNDIVPAANYYGLTVNEDGSTQRVVVRMTGTQFKKSRRLNSLIGMLRLPAGDGTTFEPPMYARVYAMASVPESNDQGAWHGWKIEPGGLLLEIAGGSVIFDEAEKLRRELDAGTARAAPIAETSPAARGDDQIPF